MSERKVAAAFGTTMLRDFCTEPLMTSTWDFAHSILAQHFKGVTNTLFYGNELSVQDHLKLRGKPRPFILSTIDLLKRIKGKTIVEVGCMRQALTHGLDEFVPICCNDGHSTAFWARTGLAVHSVDIDPACCKVAAKACEAFPNVSVTCADGIEFLRGFQGTIDLLFLDAWDAIKTIPYAEKHLEAYEIAKPKMAPTSIILIDDTDIAWGGKGRLVIPAIIRDGYDLLVTGRQTMLMRLGG